MILNGVVKLLIFFTKLLNFLRNFCNSDIDHSYHECLYRALDTTSATGFGDIPSRTNLELLIKVFGIIVGFPVLICLQAKVTAVLVNSERKRKLFQHIYYGVSDFMDKRRVPRSIQNRVMDYYKLLWKAHEGALVPRNKKAIWDAPKSLLGKVSYAVSAKLISRVPIFMHIPVQLQTEICTCMVYYILPPGEILLYPEELVRDLYIIGRGYVEVVYQNKVVGLFGQGRYFGLSGLLYGVNTGFLFRTKTDCQVFCLHYEEFRELIKAHGTFAMEYQLLQDGHKKTARGEVSVSENTPKPGKKLTKRRKSATSESSSLFKIHQSDFLYPDSEFLKQLVENGEVFEDPDVKELELDNVKWKDRLKSVCNSCLIPLSYCKPGMCYFLPYGTPLRCWNIVRLMTAALATIFAPAQLTLPISPEGAFVGTFFLDIFAWIDMYETQS